MIFRVGFKKTLIRSGYNISHFSHNFLEIYMHSRKSSWTDSLLQFAAVFAIISMGVVFLDKHAFAEPVNPSEEHLIVKL